MTIREIRAALYEINSPAADEMRRVLFEIEDQDKEARPEQEAMYRSIADGYQRAAAPIFSDESTTTERTQLHRDEYAARPKLPIAKIRDIIRSGFYLRDMMTGGTAEEFARQNCGPDLMARAAEIQALHIPERFTADRAEAAAEVERLLTTAQRWCQRRKEYLDDITKTVTAFATFQALLEAPGGYFPSLQPNTDRTRFLARCYNECQAARGDSRRAFLA